MAPGRNEHCHCGSGVKYKRCHLDLDREAQATLRQALPLLIENQAREIVMKEKLRREYSVYINFALPVQWEGGKAWALGSRVYSSRPQNETFVEFLISLTRSTFSEEWRAMQAALPSAEQHFVLKCSDEWAKFKVANSETLGPEGLYSATPNGWVQCFVSLAWDIATLIHATELPAALVERLREHARFQGARYEVAVAAIFARLDCAVDFLDDDAWRGRKHPEFIATHRPTGQRIAVEAKSRHRRGIINFPGSSEAASRARGDVQALLDRALTQALDDMPFVVFIDVNAPPDLNAQTENQWQTEIKEWMAERYPLGANEDQPLSALAITNFSPHYDGDDPAQGVEWLYYHPPNPVFPLAPEFGEILRQALDQYHRIPEITETGVIRE